MAGISFHIEKLLEEGTWTASVKSYVHSGIIATGPWMLSVFTILLLNLLKPDNFLQGDFLKFSSILVHIFALSLILCGFLYHSLTRYIADRLYMDNMTALTPTFNAVVLVVLVVQSIIGFFYFGNMEISFFIRFMAILIYLTLSLLWIIMIFLTTLKDYNFITWTFLKGIFATIILSFIFSRYIGINGYFIGYFLGYFWIMFSLVSYMFQEFHSPVIFEWDFFKTFMTHFDLVLAGFFYNFGIWVDKIIFWNSGLGMSVIKPVICSYPLYDGVIFFAYMTIIPTLVIFFLHIENNFYKIYHIFYTLVLQEGDFDNIKECKKEIFRVLSVGMRNILFYQGTITVLFILFSDKIIYFLHMKPIQIPIFRIAVGSAFLHGLFLVAMMIILYFDFKKLAMYVSLLFFALNAIFAYCSLFLDTRFLGCGYFLTSFVSLVVAFYSFLYKFHHLEYNTFVSQVFIKNKKQKTYFKSATKPK
jgi:uncharacterized membrane protein